MFKKLFTGMSQMQQVMAFVSVIAATIGGTIVGYISHEFNNYEARFSSLEERLKTTIITSVDSTFSVNREGIILTLNESMKAVIVQAGLVDYSRIATIDSIGNAKLYRSLTASLIAYTNQEITLRLAEAQDSFYWRDTENDKYYQVYFIEHAKATIAVPVAITKEEWDKVLKEYSTD